MPKDGFAAGCEIPVSGRRRARIIPTEDAGQFAVLVPSSWIDRLYQAGELADDEYDAARQIHLAFEASAIRPRLTGDYDGVVVDHCGTGGLLETLDRSEMQAWRRCGRLLAMVPRDCRSQVSAVCCWDCTPWNVRALQRGLRVLACTLRRPRR
jgi:hypothetical protein